VGELQRYQNFCDCRIDLDVSRRRLFPEFRLDFAGRPQIPAGPTSHFNQLAKDVFRGFVGHRQTRPDFRLASPPTLALSGNTPPLRTTAACIA
jgi:hypothetical protein